MMSTRNQMPVVVLNDTRVDQHHGCTRVMAAIESLVSTSGMRLLATSAAHVDWQQDEFFMAALSKARLVIVNGEGTIHHDRPAGLTLLRVAGYARSLGIPAALINFGWECNGSAAFNSLRDFALVSARDSASAEEIRAAGISCDFTPDLSLFQPAGPFSTTRIGTGFTDSVIRTNSVMLDSLRRRLNGRSVPIQYSRSGAMGCYQFFRQYVGLDDIRSPGLLTSLLRARLRQFQAQVASPDDYLERLASLRMLVSGRFHTCTLALLAKTPFVAVSSNSRKIECLVRDAGLDPCRVVAEPGDIPCDRLDSYDWSLHEMKSIKEYVEFSGQKATEIFRDMRAIG
jgi:hypothetical protein